MSAPHIFDRGLQRQRLRRALRQGYVDVLVAQAVRDLEERISVVARRFTDAIDIATPVPEAAKMLALRADRVLRLSPSVEPAAVVGDEEHLPFAAQSFDLAVSLLTLQNTNDLPGALIQIRRILKPDGLFLGCLLGGATLTELRQAFMAAEAEIEGGISPRVAPFSDIRDLGGLLQRAGFALPVIDNEILRLRYATPFGLMRDLRSMALTNTLTERSRKPLRRRTLMRAMEIYEERFADPDGRFPATFELIWLSGWAAHDSQQQPLRPGSAKMRLAQALGVREQPLDERE